MRGNVSSQYLTALLMALPLLGRRVTVNIVGELISKPYIEITLNALQRFGISVERDGWSRFVVPQCVYRSPGEIFVEGDASAASYFLAAGAISGLKGGGPVRVEGVGRSSTQGDVRFADALQAMGAVVEMGENWTSVGAGREATTNVSTEAPSPSAVMTFTGPSIAPAGTVAVICPERALPPSPLKPGVPVPATRVRRPVSGMAMISAII